MHRFSLFTLFLIFIAFNAIAQVNTPIVSSVATGIPSEDSEISFAPFQAQKTLAITNGSLNSDYYSNVAGSLVLMRKSSLVYSNGLLIKEGYLDYLNSTTPNYYYYSYKYNQSGNVTEMLWHGSRKWLTFYLPDGKIKEVWSTGLDNEPYEKSFYSYNVQGQLTEILKQTKDTVWKNTQRTLYTYNALNQVLYTVLQIVGTGGTDWLDYSKNNYTYNTNGKVESRIYQLLSSGNWVNSRKYDYAYNTAGLVAEYLYSQWFLGSWRFNSKTEYNYDNNNNPLVYSYYSYSNNLWNLTGKEEFTVNTTGSIFVMHPLPEKSYIGSVDIKWIAYSSGTVNILFSTNYGQTYTQVASGVPDTGDYSFRLEFPQGTSTFGAKVKVVSANNPAVYGENYNVFTAGLPGTNTSTVHLMNKNRLWFPLDNSGVLADVTVGNIVGGLMDSKTVIFSAGFFLSGLNNNILWANGVLSASRIQDYASGTISPQNIPVYLLDRGYGPFSSYWQGWSSAVDYGAMFYDGNNDNLYLPVDLNNNGVWDPNEDSPDILGDETVWTIYSDRVPAAMRRFADVDPQGIVVKQTAFASADTNAGTRGTIFLRYILENSGTVAQVLDSVYFSAVCDPDIGDYTDDLVACDTLLNLGYSYQKTYDGQFGNTPPAIGIDILQGPYTYIPGVTFIDINSNGIYDHGIDTPLDSAVQNHGTIMGRSYIPGAKNLGMTSFTQYMASHPTHGDPATKVELRNYQLGGMGKQGVPIDPCTWAFGTVTGVNCSLVNRKYMYSGDPVANIGWLNTTPVDQRFIVSSGPFKLEVNKPVEIIVAYSAARGNSPLGSVTLLKQENQFVQAVYDNNFINLPLSVKSNNISTKPVGFYLAQNYPNPFNPETIINFGIAGMQAEYVTLKIYDILGREVAKLVDEAKAPGSYSARFDASGLSGGVYFYKLQAGRFAETKKLLLLR